MNWNQVENMWERVKDGAESAWERVAGGLGRSTETAESDLAKGWRARRDGVERRAPVALEPWPPREFGRREAGPRPSFAALFGASLGAGLMYMFDPQQGRRRRALVRDQLVHALNKLDDGIGVLSSDLSNRTQGLVARIRSMRVRFAGESVSDEVLHARVRSKLGRVVSRPRAVEVRVRAGCVTLRGSVLAQEADRLLRAIGGVPGVGRLENQLEVHKSPEGVPALQGARARAGERAELMQQCWSPTARLLVGAVGGCMLIRGAGRGGPFGLVLGGLGAGILTRAATNIPIRNWGGTSSGTPEARDRSQLPTHFKEAEKALARVVS